MGLIENKFTNEKLENMNNILWVDSSHISNDSSSVEKIDIN